MHPLQVNVPPRNILQYSVTIEPIITWNTGRQQEPDIFYTSTDCREEQLRNAKQHMEQCLENTKTKLPDRQ